MSLDQQPPGLARRLGRDVWTLPAMLAARAERSAGAPALWSLNAADGAWRSVSWCEYRDISASIARGLRVLGLHAGETVGIMVPSCQRWDLLQMGVLAAGGVVVGLDPTELDANLDRVARRCRLAGLVVRDPRWVERLGMEARKGLRFAVHLGPAVGGDRLLAYDELLRLADPAPADRWDAPGPDDPATIIFTSGTTGEPKGIRYTHRQVCLAVASILDAFPDIDEGSRLVCWLPLSNMFQRVIDALAIASGAETYFVEDPREVMRHVASIGPHLFIGVPRFYEKLYAGIMEQVGRGSRWQRALVGWALRVGDHHAGALRAGVHPGVLQRARHVLADRLVLQRLRSVMGPNLRYMVSGSAPTPRWLLERFHAMGLLVLEAYGLSENVIPVASNRPGGFRLGTVGRPLRGSEVRLAEDGELMVRGPGCIRAYYGEEQADLLDREGYLATGDFATIDRDGFVTLNGRKSEIIKTATGRRIGPAAIEGVLLQAPGVEQAVVLGAHRPYLVALVALSPAARAVVPASRTGESELIARCERLRQDLASLMAPLPAYQRPAGLVVTTRQFSVEGGDLTPNLKLRRHAIAVRRAAEIERLYHLLDSAAGAPVLERVVGDAEDTVLCSL